MAGAAVNDREGSSSVTSSSSTTSVPVVAIPDGGLESLHREPATAADPRPSTRSTVRAERTYVRSPVFLGRLLLAAVAVVVLATLPDALDLAVAGLRGDLSELVSGTPGSIPRLTDAVAIAVGLL